MPAADLRAAQSDAQAAQALALARRFWIRLQGEHPATIGATLADLVSLWLAEHVIVGDTELTAGLRESRLGVFVDTVRGLIPLSEEIIRHEQSEDEETLRREQEECS